MLVQIYEVQTPEEAVALARRGVDHIGVLVGDGVLRAKFESQVAALGLSDRFRFLGLTPPPSLLLAVDEVIE